MTTYKIHPSIGIARLGNSEDFYLAPEQPGALPMECDHDGQEILKDGKPVRIENFKDVGDLSKVKRQAARFKVFHYKDDNDNTGEEIQSGKEYEFILQTNVTALKKVKGTVTDIVWTVHLANKKSSWYEFNETQGMHGYPPMYPLRNPEVIQPDLRRQLITDPGPQSVGVKFTQSKAHFARGDTQAYPQTFPPMDIKPHRIDTLGELIANEQDGHQRLIVLGGKGNSGSSKPSPVITSFVNNDGWFDDISDGPVTATIHYDYCEVTYDGKKEIKTKKSSTMDVPVPAWVVVGYPRFVPEMEDMITLDEALYDVFVRNMAHNPQIYGVPPFNSVSNSPKNSAEMAAWKTSAQFNPNFYPKFYQDVWPILRRPDLYKYVFDFDFFGGGDPHNTGTGGNLDEKALAQPPHLGKDPNKQIREFVYSILRQPNQINEYISEPNKTPDGNLQKNATANNKPRLMPLLCGNNPLSNVSPDKFLAMTDTQLFILKQWANGKFVNECQEWKEGDKHCKTPWSEPPISGPELDRGVLSNLLGGAFCPGGELSWIMLNPGIYSEPYRVRHATYIAGALSLPKSVADIDGSTAANISAGMEPGDLTKYIGIPWQADFHECTYQNIDVTYENWNNIYLDSTGDPAVESIAYNIPWWPAHRPIVIQEPTDTGSYQAYWASGIPPNKAGDLQMVDAWKDLGFIKRMDDDVHQGFFQIERNNQALGAPVTPGDRELGQSTNAMSSKKSNASKNNQKRGQRHDG